MSRTIILHGMLPRPRFPSKVEAPFSPEQDLTSDPRWELIQRILQSPPFQKSANLHGLLPYLAEHSIRGEREVLTERQIGRAAFGKPEDYSPAEDSAVRVHVRQLRLRLHEYFAHAGPSESLLVEIPKGSYALEFTPKYGTPEIVAPQPVPIAPSKETTSTRAFPWRDLLLWIALAAAALCAMGWYRAVKANASSHAIPWPLNAVIQPNQETRVIVSDSSSMLRLLGDKELTLDQYLQPDFRSSLIPPHLPPNLARLVDYISGSQLTSFADLVVASSIARLGARSGNTIQITSARNLNLRDLEEGNYVFIGSPTSNPWVGLFTGRLNFQVVEEGVGGKMSFLNKKPLSGEQERYEGLPRTGSAGEEYATISLLPTSTGHGNVLILQGLRQEGTEALGELLQSSEYRAQLQKTLHISGDASKPVYFEALIHARVVAGAPVSISIVATRPIQP